MKALELLLHLVGLALLPFLLTGLINRTKAVWAGRKGPPLWQSLFDVVRLLKKRPVYSETTTAVFRLSAWVGLGCALLAATLVPLLARGSPFSFALDFVFFAYALGVGRLFLMLGALDTGSAFEGMGAAREATFSAMGEPALFLVAGTLSAASGQGTFAGLLAMPGADPLTLAVRGLCVVALFVLLQLEAARVPVDDPNTHLELTMIHEVMILDHSGPDLAALQYTAGLKLTLFCALIAAVVNPLPASAPAWQVASVNVGVMVLVALLVGTVESLIARFKMRVIPQYALGAAVAAFVALLAGVVRSGGPS